MARWRREVKAKRKLLRKMMGELQGNAERDREALNRLPLRRRVVTAARLWWDGLRLLARVM